MPFINFFLLLIYFIVLIAKPANATALQSAELERFIKQYLEQTITPPPGGKIVISVASIDPRIIIKPCQQDLSANIPENHGGRNINVKISCNDSTPWSMFIPAKIEKTYAVLIAKNTIEKGAILSQSNIAIEYLPRNKLRGKRLSNIDKIVGSKAKKRIGKNKVISRNSVCLVCKGDVVTIIAKSDNFIIKAKGTALTDGNLNEQIKVENSRSGKIIRPKVSAVNQVTIHL